MIVGKRVVHPIGSTPCVMVSPLRDCSGEPGRLGQGEWSLRELSDIDKTMIENNQLRVSGGRRLLWLGVLLLPAVLGGCNKSGSRVVPARPAAAASSVAAAGYDAPDAITSRSDASASTDDGSCRYEATRGLGFTVAPEGAPPFRITAYDARVIAEPTDEDKTLRATIHGTLAFTASISVYDLGLRLVEPLTVGDDAIELAAQSFAVTLDQLQGKVRAGFLVGAAGTNRGNQAVYLRHVTLACRDLAVSSSSLDDPLLAGEGTTLVGRTKTVEVFFEARGDQFFRLTGLNALVVLYATDKDNGWTRVTSEWAGGSAIRGWVRDEELRTPTPEEARAIWKATTPWPDDPADPGDRTVYGGVVGDPDIPVPFGTRLRWAELEVGTAIYAEPGAGRWASVVRPKGYRVGWNAGVEWIAVVEVPSMGGLVVHGIRPQWHAWVRRSAVSIVDDAQQ